MFYTCDLNQPLVNLKDELKVDKILKVSDGMKVSKINKKMINIVADQIPNCYQKFPSLLRWIDDEENNTLFHILLMK